MAKQGQTVIVLMAGLLAGGARMAHAVSGAIAGAERRQMDPITGLRWQWTRNAQHPEAPPQLTLVRGSDASVTGRRATATKCVHSGDKMRVKMRTVSDGAMSIEATALAAGGRGDRVPARILITGARVEITILDAGIGVLEARNEAWR